jgi:hypothetical protein
VEISRPLDANFSPFNTLLLFAQFECNIIFFSRTHIQTKLSGWHDNKFLGDRWRCNSGKPILFFPKLLILNG